MMGSPWAALLPIENAHAKPEQNNIWICLEASPVQIHQRGRKRKPDSDIERLVAYLKKNGTTTSAHIAEVFGWTHRQVQAASRSVRVRVVNYVGVECQSVRAKTVCAIKPGAPTPKAVGKYTNAKTIFELLAERDPMTYDQISEATGIPASSIRNTIEGKGRFFVKSTVNVNVPMIQYCSVLECARL